MITFYFKLEGSLLNRKISNKNKYKIVKLRKFWFKFKVGYNCYKFPAIKIKKIKLKTLNILYNFQLEH